MKSNSRNTAERRLLVVCIIAAIASGSSVAIAERPSPTPTIPRGSVHEVSNCDDNGSGSFRDAVESAADGDIVSVNPMQCSEITLTTGEVVSSAASLTIEGNADRRVTIGAGNASRVLKHAGAGTLTISSLTLTEGSIITTPLAAGGCIYSAGSLSLSNVSVKNCHVETIAGSSFPRALGGGIFTVGQLTLLHSEVSGNVAKATPGSAFNYSYVHGGGIFASSILNISNSVVSNNMVLPLLDSAYYSGGGIWSAGGTTIELSTISGNSAAFAGGLYLSGDSGTHIENSTISGNTGAYGNGGITSNQPSLELVSSTVAFNAAQNGNNGFVQGAGVVLFRFNETLVFESSIVAKNDAAGMPDDVSINFPGGIISGSANIIGASNGAIPADTITDDPLLGPLADNGGPTQTHALLDGSPAIDAGTNSIGAQFDQRGPGYARVSGRAADIGALEVQQPVPPDPIFSNGFD